MTRRSEQKVNHDHVGDCPQRGRFWGGCGHGYPRYVNERYDSFSRSQWALLREATPLELTEGDLAELRGINERLDLEEVANIYLPLSRLLNLHITATPVSYTHLTLPTKA